MKIFTIYDTKGEFFSPPFYQRSHGEAERNFKTLVNDQKSTISTNPEDFDLYHLGEFDELTGKIRPLDAPSHVTKAIALKA